MDNKSVERKSLDSVRRSMKFERQEKTTPNSEVNMETDLAIVMTPIYWPMIA